MLTRREVLQSAAVAMAAPALGDELPRLIPPKRRKAPTRKIAVVASTYYYLSHAYHICGRFLDGYLVEGQIHHPDFGIAGMYVEQQKDNDLSKELCKKHGIPLHDSIAGALTLGGDKLAVDGVLLICEHGDYPYNTKGQRYLCYEYFRKIVEVFERSKRSVPVFCDKHLYYDRTRAKEMVETAKKMGFPLMAGSSLPVTWRRPELELPLGVKIKEALVASRGELEIFGIHSLEVLQCMVERRLKGQQGVKGVTCLEGDAVWKAGDAGLWSWKLLEHAVGRSPSRNAGDIRENCRHYRAVQKNEPYRLSPMAFLIEYRDGLKASVLVVNGHVDDTTFAAEIEGKKEPVSTLFYLPPPPGAAFLEALSMKVEAFLTTGKPPYPVERTLLTGGILDVALESRAKRYAKIETPELDVSYDPPADSGFMRGDYARVER